MSWYLLAAIPVFGVLILVHEFGHFITAKWAGIRVDEFALGFPPRLLSVKRGETTYSLNALPIGGYVRMPGENGETTDENGNYDSRTFAAKSPGKRAIVLLAGITMNILLAVFCFTAAEVVGQVNFVSAAGTVLSGSPAADAGIHPHDTILAIDGHKTRSFSDLVTQVGAATDAAPAGAKTVPIVMVVRHAGSNTPVTLTVNALVNPGQGQGHLGITSDQSQTYVTRVPLWQAPIKGVQDIGDVIGGTVSGISQVIAGKLAVSQAVMGPVGIVSTTGEVASTVPVIGWYLMFYLVGALSISLAIVNLLPIPALDGGRVLFIGIEVLRRGKRISPEREGLVNLIGMAALLFLMLLVTINDVGNLFHH
ncbi:MAG TPA: M50 family metallopeptidase [Ktedonobacterales bacterium]|nr:M50 family metallopeptidase [Ktedonobacterales bacterium]